MNKSYSEKLAKINPKIKCLIYSHPFLDTVKNEDEFIIRYFEEFGPSLKINDRVRFVNEIAKDEFEFLDTNKAIYPEITKLLKELKPDFFIYDQIMTVILCFLRFFW